MPYLNAGAPIRRRRNRSVAPAASSLVGPLVGLAAAIATAPARRLEPAGDVDVAGRGIRSTAGAADGVRAVVRLSRQPLPLGTSRPPGAMTGIGVLTDDAGIISTSVSSCCDVGAGQKLMVGTGCYL